MCVVTCVHGVRLWLERAASNRIAPSSNRSEITSEIGVRISSDLRVVVYSAHQSSDRDT